MRQHAQPAERIDALESLESFLGNRLARHAVEAVAAGDVVACEFDGRAVFDESHARLVRVDVMQLDLLRLEDARCAAGRTRIHQVLRDYGQTEVTKDLM